MMTAKRREREHVQTLAEALAIRFPHASEKRLEHLVKAASAGATDAQLDRVAVVRATSTEESIPYSTRYGHHSRGKAWARQGSGSSPIWAEKNGGTVYLTPGRWVVGSDDGFRRKEKVTVKVTNIKGILILE